MCYILSLDVVGLENHLILTWHMLCCLRESYNMSTFLMAQVIKLLENEGIKWSEENRGTILIKLSGYREFNFLDSHSDTE